MQPRSVTADAAYGTTENIAAIEKAGIHAYTALVDHEKRPSLFGRDAFTYDAKKTSTPVLKARSCAVKATTTGRGP